MRNSKELVLEAVRELHAQEQVVTRETLAEHTGLTMTVVDDRIAVLVDDGQVIRVQRGVFIPAPTWPIARPISKTILPDGFVKIEIGDEVLTLTPRESRALGELTSAAAQQFAAIELGRQANEVTAELAQRITILRRLHQRAGGGYHVGVRVG